MTTFAFRSASAPVPPPGWLVALGLGLQVALTLLTRLPFLGHPAADFDEQLYSLIGQNLLAGQLPYVDLWDRKPVGLFLLYAAAHAIGGPGPLAYQLVAMAACLWGGWLTFRLGCRLTDSASAAFASALYPLLMAIYSSHSGQSEIFFTPLILAMLALVLRAADHRSPRLALPPLALAMTLGGLALQVKYTVLPACLWLGLVGLWQLYRKAARPAQIAAAAALFALLGLLPTLAAAAYYASRGALNAFLFANFLSIGLRAPMPAHYALAKQVIYILPLALLAAGGLLYARRPPVAWWLALGWLIAASLGLFMGTTIYPYYYAALVPAAILVALPMLERANRLGPLLLGGILVWLLAVANPPKRFADTARERAALEQLTALARPHVGAQDHCLFVHDGPVALYRLTSSCLPTRLIYPDHLNNALEARALPAAPAAEVARILANRPGVIITSPQPVTVANPQTAALVRAELARHYTRVRTVPFQDRPIELWLRQSSGGADTKKPEGSPLPAF